MTERFEQQMADLRLLAARPPVVLAMPVRGHPDGSAAPGGTVPSSGPAGARSAQPVPISGQIAQAAPVGIWARIRRVLRRFGGFCPQCRRPA